MSENRREGEEHYRDGGDDARAWFERQWAIWPTRADERFTTNISFLYGGVVAYRDLNATEPALSRQFRGHVTWHDDQLKKENGND